MRCWWGGGRLADGEACIVKMDYLLEYRSVDLSDH